MNNAKYPLILKVKEWIQLSITVGGNQILIQGVGFVAGVFIIRRIAPAEYALYTLANTMLGTMNLLADGGISYGVISEGGKVWKDPEKLGVVVATGIALRKRFAIISVAISAPLLVYLFRSHGATWYNALALLAAVAGTFWCYLLGSIFTVAPNLHQQVGRIQRVLLTQGLARLGGLLLLLSAIPVALTAMIAGLIAQLWSVTRIRRLSNELISVAHAGNNEVREKILQIVRRLWPDLIYFSFSSQLTIWLISIFGTTVALAQIGALGRLGQATTVVLAFMVAVIVPRFARLQAGRAFILRRYFQVLLLFTLTGALMVGLVGVFPKRVLWILGPQYTGLTREVLLLAAGSAMGLISAAAYHLALARGCVVHPVIGIGLQLAWQIIWIFKLNLGSVQGVLWLGILTPAFQLLLHAANMVVQTMRIEDKSSRVVPASNRGGQIL